VPVNRHKADSSERIYLPCQRYHISPPPNGFFRVTSKSERKTRPFLFIDCENPSIQSC